MNRSMGHGNDLRNADARPNGREDADRQKLSAYDLVCFSHLRWDFVFQRPHHLLGRNAAFQRVFYVEEPVDGTGEPWLELRRREGGVVKVVPHLPPGLDAGAAEDVQRRLVDDFLKAHGVIDAAHFEAAQGATVDPDDQAGIPRPRLGYFGVIDERMDLDLLDGIARRRPDWHLVLIGPTNLLHPARRHLPGGERAAARLAAAEDPAARDRVGDGRHAPRRGRSLGTGMAGTPPLARGRAAA